MSTPSQAKPVRRTRPAPRPLPGWVVCTSDDHGLTVHAEGSTNPYDGPKPTCRLSDHRPLLWQPKVSDGDWT